MRPLPLSPQAPARQGLRGPRPPARSPPPSHQASLSSVYPLEEAEFSGPLHPHLAPATWQRTSNESLLPPKSSFSHPDESELHLGLPPDVHVEPWHAQSEGWLARQQPPEHGDTRQVQLTDGHWIVDHPVPTPVANAVEAAYRAQGQSTEFTHLRYSAVTCDPDEFLSENGWGLRTSSEYGRETELLIALTYYNEDRHLLTRTLHSVMQNIRDLCKHRWSRYWRACEEEGRPAWQRICLLYTSPSPRDRG